MRTREQIEAQSVEEPRKAAKRKVHPNSLKNLVAPWKPGQTGNPEGKNGRDMAQLICRAAFENNPEVIYKAIVKLLAKGSAFGLQVAAERAYGKLKETKELIHRYEETADGDLQQRIDSILADLGLAGQIDTARGAKGAQGRAGETQGQSKDTPILS